MNILFKIAGISLLFVLMSVFLKINRPEYVFLLRVFAIISIIFLIIDYIESFIESSFEIFNLFNIESSHISLLIKITGIAIMTDFISDTLTDNGETAMANIVITFSKIIVTLLSFPVLNGIVAFCLKLIE